MALDTNDTAAVAAAQTSELAAFEQTLHGHSRETWAFYREMTGAAVALVATADRHVAAIAALAADESKPAEFRRTETERMRQAATQELAELRGTAKTAAARLESRLKSQLVPQPPADPAARALARDELRAALAGIDPSQCLTAGANIARTAPPEVVAELASSYGAALLGPEAAALFSQTMIGVLRQRGGLGDASRAAELALTEFERRKLAGRIDGLWNLAATRLNPSLPARRS
ncbi:MAG: hypothetical protein ACHQ0J_01835 [Candidatus Dormibacterales bacterium]